MLTFHSFPHHAPYSFGIPPSLPMPTLLGTRGGGRLWNFGRTACSNYDITNLGSHGLLCPPPANTPLLGSTVMPYDDLAFPLHSLCLPWIPHYTPCSPCIHSLIMAHVHLSFIPHHTPYSPGIPPSPLCLPCISLLGIRGVAGIETLGPHIVMMTSLIVYCLKCLRSKPHPPHQPLPCLDSRSCHMLTWRPFPSRPMPTVNSHHTPCSPSINSLIIPHVHLSFIHPSCPILT